MTTRAAITSAPAPATRFPASSPRRRCRRPRRARDGETVGEVVARGDVIMDGYWKRPADSLTAMQGGWFHTGDLATIDDDHYVLIVDRKKDIIVSGGENISSLEVEKVLVAHPAVYEAVVIPVPHEKWGEVPKGSGRAKTGRGRDRTGTGGVLPFPAGALQVSAVRGLSRQLSQDRHGQDPEAE